jgi:hypothetical protein
MEVASADAKHKKIQQLQEDRGKEQTPFQKQNLHCEM